MKERAAGGVVFDSDGRVLVRRPRGGFGGYAWTFAKGRVDPGESLEACALREVREETGVDARVRARIPGEFEGDVTVTTYFVMDLVGVVGTPDDETEAVRWVSADEARALFGETPNARGRARDLAVLAGALAAAGPHIG